MRTSRAQLLGRRLLAYGGDVAVIFLYFFVTQRFLLAPLRTWLEPDWMRSGYALELYTLATISAPVWLYLAASESSPMMATLGKRLLGLKVRNVNGKPLTFPRSFLRAIVKC